METAAARETAHQGQVGLGRTGPREMNRRSSGIVSGVHMDTFDTQLGTSQDTCLRKQHPTHAEEELGLHQYNTHHLVHSDSCFVDVNGGKRNCQNGVLLRLPKCGPSIRVLN